MKIFWMKSESSLTLPDSKGPTTFKAQKRSKDIVKMIRDISRSTVILRSYENISGHKENKNNENNHNVCN